MKKHLLIASGLLLAFGAYSQQLRTKAVTKTINMAEKVSAKYQLRAASENVSALQEVPVTKATVKNRAKKSSGPNDWQAISKSMNIYGVLYADQKAVQYNDELNAVSFIHRKSPTYTVVPTPAPDSETGGIVGMYTTNWGGKWDSTLLWADDINWGRYPQGGIYNPLGNTNITNAHLAAMGPVTGASAATWVGNFFASKKLDVPNNSISTVDEATRFISHTGPTYDTIGKVYMAANDFSATDDGLIRTLGVIMNDPNSTSAVGQGFRGARIVKGTYNAGGYFDWTSDSLSLHSIAQQGTDGTYDALGGVANMAWSESGQYGYVWFIGVRVGTDSSNSGFQPIVWKTSTYGNAWSLLPGINFKDKAFAPVLNQVPPVRLPLSDTDMVIPFFNFREDIAGTVDKFNQLHLVSALWGSAKSHPDSVGYTSSFSNDDGEAYTYGHVDGHRPYIYDFTTKEQGGWNWMLIDSLETEAPGDASTEDGYEDNPWDKDGTNSNSKVSSAARIQLSRTPGGEFIIYTWAESNTLVTASGKKWNNIPNVMGRVYDVINSKLQPDEYNLTEHDEFVGNNAQMHQTSPKSQLVVNGADDYTIRMPIKVSNSIPLRQLLPNTHYFSGAEFYVKYIGIEEHANSVILKSSLYPNPARNAATLAVEMRDNSEITIGISNITGQLVKSENTKATAGKNEFTFDVSDLAAGIYVVSVKTNSGTIGKKLIVE
jgi:hypothetical protein